MLRRFLLITIAFSLPVLVWGRLSMVHGQTNVEKAKPRIPVNATLSAPTVQPNDQEKITITTLANTQIQLRVIYPQAGGFKTHGLSGKRGKWQHAWAVHATSAGQATVVLYFAHGKVHRYYTLHFTVVTPSPTPTITPIPTATSTATPSSGPPPPPGPQTTNVPTATPVATVTSTAPATATGTQTATVTATPVLTGTLIASNNDVQVQSVALYTDASQSGPAGNEQSLFPTSTAAVHAWVVFSVLNGAHDVTFNWYAPDGTPYTTTQHLTGSGQMTATTSLPIAGQDAANKVGNWLLVMSVDSRISDTQGFLLYQGTPPVATSNTISLSSSQLYSSVRPDGSPTGSSQTSFSASTPTVYAYANFSDWEGAHTVTFNWYAPDGSLFAGYTDTSTHFGPVADYSALNVAGTTAASKLGTWRVDVLIDGQLANEPFTLTQ